MIYGEKIKNNNDIKKLIKVIDPDVKELVELNIPSDYINKTHITSVKDIYPLYTLLFTHTLLSYPSYSFADVHKHILTMNDTKVNDILSKKHSKKDIIEAIKGDSVLSS